MKAEIEETKRLDLNMEVERVKGLREEMMREEKRFLEAKDGRRVISEQIKLNHMRHLKEREEAAEEATEYIKRAKALQLEEYKKQDEKKRNAAKI